METSLLEKRAEPGTCLADEVGNCLWHVVVNPHCKARMYPVIELSPQLVIKCDIGKAAML